MIRGDHKATWERLAEMRNQAGSNPQLDRSDFWKRHGILDLQDVLQPKVWDLAGLQKFYTEQAKPFVDEFREYPDANIRDVVKNWEKWIQKRISFLQKVASLSPHSELWGILQTFEEEEVLRVYDYAGLERFYLERIEPFFDGFCRDGEDHILTIVESWESWILCRKFFLYVVDE